MARHSRRKLKRKFPFVVFCLIVAILLGSGLLLARGWLGSLEPLDISDIAIWQGSLKRLNFLLLGSDARKGETKARADSIMVISVDIPAKKLAILSIPRDTRVYIPQHGWDRVNAATVYGGPELAKATVSTLLDIPLDYYVCTNYKGFKEVVDILGGVDIYVERNMHHYDPQDNGAYTINLKKGEQRLNGEKALQYVRFRGYNTGDIERTQHQQKFLEALAREALKPANVVKLPKLVYVMSQYVETDLGVKEMYKLAKAAASLEDLNIIAQTLPGHFLDYDGISYWSVEPWQAKQIAKELFEDGKVSKVVMGPTENGGNVRRKISEPLEEYDSGTNHQAPEKSLPKTEGENQFKEGNPETVPPPGNLDNNYPGDIIITPVEPGEESNPGGHKEDSINGKVYKQEAFAFTNLL